MKIATLNVVPMDQAARGAEELFPSVKRRLPNILTYVAPGSYTEVETERLLNTAYVERAVQYPAILLGYCENCTIFGQHNLMARVGDCVVAEHIAPEFRDNPDALLREVNWPLPMDEEVVDECVLLGRWGAATWGHWLGEIVPLAAAIEHRFPGRFRYAINRLARPEAPIQKRFIEPLLAYGISADRLIYLRQDRQHVIRKVWLATPLWTRRSPHPLVIDLARSLLRPKLRERAKRRFDRKFRKIAIVRKDVATRNMANYAFVAFVLNQRGYRVIDMAPLAFSEQVAVFQQAESVFGVIGSGLTGLLYSPDGVKVAATGPAGWGDDFFYAIAQHRRAKWAEVRGSPGHPGNRDANFSPPDQYIDAALEILEG